MAWVKIPAENHPLFHAALPVDRRITTINMFGGVAALVNGNMFGGLFARSALVKLGPDDYAAAMQLDGSEPFDPMGTGRVMSNTVLLSETVMDEPGELRAWLRKAFDYTVTLPPKKKKSASSTAASSKAASSTAASSKAASSKAASSKAASSKAASSKAASSKAVSSRAASSKSASSKAAKKPALKGRRS